MHLHVHTHPVWHCALCNWRNMFHPYFALERFAKEELIKMFSGVKHSCSLLAIVQKW